MIGTTSGEDRPTGGIEAELTAGRFAMLLGVLLLAAYPEVLLFGETFVFRDFGIFGYPLAAYHRESFWQGEIPLWNPLNNCGIPYLAQWNTLTLYPFSLFYLLLPLPWSLNFFCLGHLFLAGMGMYVLAHRWSGNRLAASFAGVVFASNGLLLNSLMWPNNIAALGWMPWVVWAVERAWQKGGHAILLAALVGALQMLAGSPEIIVFTWMVLLALWIVEAIDGRQSRLHQAGRTAGIIALISGLAAAQLLPFLDLLLHSDRHASFGADSWSMPIWGWANLFVPLFRCYQSPPGVFFQYDQDWTSSYYICIAAWALALAAPVSVRRRRTWLLWGASVLGLILALGAQAHLYAWLLKVFPPLGFMRFPIKFVVLPVFAVPLLAAFGLARIEGMPDSDRSKARRLAVCVGISFVALIVAIIGISYFYPYRNEQWTAVFRNGVTRIILIVLILGILLAKARLQRFPSKLIACFALLLLAGIDGLTHAPRQNPTTRPGVFEPGVVARELSPRPDLGGARALMHRHTHERLYRWMVADPFADYVGHRFSLFGNCNLLDAIPTPDGFYSLYPPRQREVWQRVYQAMGVNPPEALLDFLSVGFVTHPRELFQWEKRTTFLPLATIGPRPVFVDAAQLPDRLSSAEFNPRQIVYLPTEAESVITAAGSSTAGILSMRLTAHRQVFEVETTGPTLLVLSQTFYHRWKALADGTPIHLWRANHAFQAVELPAGTRQLELVYRDHAFYWGVAISLFTLLGCVAAWFLRRR